MISAIEATVGQSAILNFEPAQPGDVSANVLDSTKMQSATGWTPATILADGLAQTWDWMKPKIFRRWNDG
jgi:UDP-glucose 4-epimerase